MTSFKTLLGGAAAVSAITAAWGGAQALAQNFDDDVILVTAQRKEQDIQDVPASVTNLSEQDLIANQVDDITDLQYLVPNISIAAGTGTANSARIFLRGVGEDESRGAVDPAVGVYIDGVYMGRQVGSLFDLVDVERVEVLRGPQGTLYGRNTNGGAIKLVSKRPEFRNGAELRTIVGNEGRLDLRATGNLQLGERTAIRVTGFSRDRDGFWELNPNGPGFEDNGGEFGELKTRAVRASFLHEMNDDWSVLAAFDFTDDMSDPIPDSAAPPNDRDNDVFTIEPLPGATCAPGPINFRPLGCFGDYDNNTKNMGYSLNVEGRVGAYDINVITAYRAMEDDLVTRIGAPYFQETDQDQFTQELTISSDFDGPFNYVAGLYYFTEDVQLDTVFFAPASVGVDTEAAAIFAQGFLEVGEAGTFTFGARYTDETKDLNAAGPAGTRTESADFENFNYTLRYDHQFTDDLMVYGAFSTGFKSGAWSADCFSPTSCFLPVEEETLESFEVGTRTDWLDGRLRFNATYFYNDYEGLQINATVPGLGFTRFNVAEAKIQGLEFELNYAITDQFTLFGNLGLLDAEYESITPGQASGLTNAGASCDPGQDLVECALGLDLKNAPEFKGMVGASYAFPIFAGELTLRGDVQFEDESWSLVANGPPHALTDPGLLLNARVSYRPDEGDWYVAAWGQNLTNEEYWRAASGNSFTAYAAPPITYGVELGITY